MEEMSRRRFLKLGGVAVGAVALGGAGYAATWAPGYDQPSKTMGDGMGKALVVYGTTTGCTEGVAERIGKVLADRGMTAEIVAAAKAPTPAGYDAVFVGSGIRMGSWHGSAKEWVKANASSLKNAKVAFYSVGLTLASDPTKTAEVRAYTDPLIAESGVTPVDVGTFAGMNDPGKFSFLERTILGLMKSPQGDFRDWAAIEAWTGKTADAMGLVG
jgi:menaquinone-dependent protoporphyrinogen oxidase